MSDDYVRREDLRVACELLSTAFLEALIEQRREFDATRRDYELRFNEISAILAETIDAMKTTASNLEGASRVTALLSRFVIHNNGLTPEALFAIVVDNDKTGDPAVIEFMRVILDAWPAPRLVRTEPAEGRAITAPPSIARERPSLSMVNAAPATRRE